MNELYIRIISYLVISIIAMLIVFIPFLIFCLYGIHKKLKILENLPCVNYKGGSTKQHVYVDDNNAVSE